jgi:hypothetical protein
VPVGIDGPAMVALKDRWSRNAGGFSAHDHVAIRRMRSKRAERLHGRNADSAAEVASGGVPDIANGNSRAPHSTLCLGRNLS